MNDNEVSNQSHGILWDGNRNCRYYTVEIQPGNPKTGLKQIFKVYVIDMVHQMASAK